MIFWASMIAYHVVWFSAVIGAEHGHIWPGLLALGFYVAGQLSFSHTRRADLSLAATGLIMGFLLDGTLAHTRMAHYSAAWPSAGLAPAWILTLWAAFPMTFTKSLTYLQRRLWIATLFGAIGGPLAYMGAARTFDVVRFTDPAWHGLLCLGLGWALATPALAWLARRWSTVTNAAWLSFARPAT
jgi:hypothetical protein